MNDNPYVKYLEEMNKWVWATANADRTLSILNRELGKGNAQQRIALYQAIDALEKSRPAPMLRVLSARRIHAL